jgi:DNA mismatch repair protein MutS
MADDLPLFANMARECHDEPAGSPVLEALEALSPDALSPKEALEKLYELKTLLKN